MSNVQTNTNRSKSMKKGRQDVQHAAEEMKEGIRERFEHARDVVETVRERAEETFRERPYLVPVAAGAVGLITGILLGSKITRFILFTALGTVVSEALGGEIKRFSKELASEMQHRLTEGSREDDESDLQVEQPAE
jgi:ElaB/YqjD/DUF883 family membrane-anchored ribosome-binding protein